MNPQSGFTAADADLSELLDAAEKRHRAVGGRGDFRDDLIQVLATHFAADAIRVWEHRVPGGMTLLAEFGDSASRDQERIQRESAVDAVHQRSEQAEGREANREAYLAASTVCDGIRILLEFLSPWENISHPLISDLCEVFADLHRRRLLAELLKRSDQEQHFRQLVGLLHGDLDEVRIIHTLASDAAEFLDCRRISVLKRVTRWKWELKAATGVSEPDVRSDAARRLCRLVQSVSEAAVDGGSAAAAPEEQSAEQATELTAVSSPSATAPFETDQLLVRPLSVTQRWLDADWAAVFEFADQDAVVAGQQNADLLCRHAATALRNCRTLKDKSSFSVLRHRFQMVSGGKLLAGLAVLSIVLAWALLTPIEMKIEVPGRLVPVIRRYVFAPDEGTITLLNAEDGRIVRSGDVLCVLTNDSLELQLEGLRGELGSARARLAAVESLRGDRSLTQTSLLSAEQAELSEKVRSLEQQMQMLRARIEHLTIQADIDGQVHGERIREMLSGRPVTRGQYLFEIADVKGPWELELRIAETDIRHVVKAVNRSSEPPVVTFTLETSPEHSMQTTLTQLLDVTDIDARGVLSTRATAIFPGDIDLETRPGAGVLASIHCGRRAAGFVWFRRLIELVQTRL